MPDTSEIIAKLNAHEQEAIKKSTSELGRNVICTVYKRQRTEICRLYPQIKDTFKNNLARAFSSTFRFASFIVSISVILSFFCENAASKAALSRKEGNPEPRSNIF
jgi:hypothetical protein